LSAVEGKEQTGMSAFGSALIFGIFKVTSASCRIFRLARAASYAAKTQGPICLADLFQPAGRKGFQV
jgi:hypothetical protein